MSLTRWQPIQEMLSLRDAMDNLFDESFFQPINTRQGVPLDVIEEDDALVVRAVIPGFEPEQIDVSLQGDVLTLQGRIEEQQNQEQGSYHLREYRHSAFQRSVRLPVAVQSDAAEAEYRNGVLTLRLPKSPEASTRRISVRKSE